MAQFIRIATRKARSLLHIIIGIPAPVEVQLIKAEISSGAGQAFDSRRMACNYDRSQVPLNYTASASGTYSYREETLAFTSQIG